MLSPLLPPWLFVQSTVFMCSFLSPSFGVVFFPPVSLKQLTTLRNYKPSYHKFNCIEYDLTISHAIQHFQCQILLVSVHSSQSLQDYCTITIAEYLFNLIRSDLLNIIEQVYYNSKRNLHSSWWRTSCHVSHHESPSTFLPDFSTPVREFKFQPGQAR